MGVMEGLKGEFGTIKRYFFGGKRTFTKDQLEGSLEVIKEMHAKEAERLLEMMGEKNAEKKAKDITNTHILLDDDTGFDPVRWHPNELTSHRMFSVPRNGLGLQDEGDKDFIHTSPTPKPRDKIKEITIDGDNRHWVVDNEKAEEESKLHTLMADEDQARDRTLIQETQADSLRDMIP